MNFVDKVYDKVDDKVSGPNDPAHPRDRGLGSRCQACVLDALAGTLSHGGGRAPCPARKKKAAPFDWGRQSQRAWFRGGTKVASGSITVATLAAAAATTTTAVSTATGAFFAGLGFIDR